VSATLASFFLMDSIFTSYKRRRRRVAGRGCRGHVVGLVWHTLYDPDSRAHSGPVRCEAG